MKIKQNRKVIIMLNHIIHSILYEKLFLVLISYNKFKDRK